MKPWESFWVALVAVATATLVRGLIGGWAVMLAVGIIHHEWLPQLPTIGYWPATLITPLVWWAFGSWKPSTDGDR